MNDSIFANWLRLELEEREWDYAQAAQHANVAERTVSEVMGGTLAPDLDFLISMAAALRLPPEELVYQASYFPVTAADETQLLEFFEAPATREYVLRITFSAWLRAEMRQRRWTPAQLARQSQQLTLKDVLSGQRTPSYIVRERLARTLGVPAAEVHHRAGAQALRGKNGTTVGNETERGVENESRILSMA